jgi:hypothetical protein
MAYLKQYFSWGVVLFLLSFNSLAGNVDLATVPPRQSVQLTIYNSEDLTLVQETRTMVFKSGINPLQFSWANTLIDPTSVELQFADPAAGLEVLDTTFPHDKAQALYWNVQSDSDQEAVIQISYFTSGIDWQADYLLIADDSNSTLALTSFVRVNNQSGEDYENAQVRLVVGTINLVEKIAELAQMPVAQLNDMESDQYSGLRQQAAKMLMRQSMPMPSAAPMVEMPKAVVKESLSEYFIYTIEGTETVPSGWAKRLRSFAAEAVPFREQYRYRLHEYGDQLVRMLLLRNDEASNLGTTPLPDGEVRIFQHNGRGGLSYLTQQTLRYVPIGDRLELNLGPDPAVVFELIKLNAFRDQIWLRQRSGNLYRRLDEPGLQIDLNAEVAGWDEHIVYSQRIRNFHDRAIAVEIRRSYPGDVIFRSPLDALQHDFNTVQFSAEVPARGQQDLQHEIISRQGYNSRQNAVEIVQEAVQLR